MQTQRLGVGENSFSFTHTFADDAPIGTPQDDYDVLITIDDEDGGVYEFTRTITVNNIAPRILIIDDGSTDDEIRVRAVVTDVPGDPVTYSWTVNNEVPAGVVIDTDTLVLDRNQYNGFITVEAFVTDDDNETSALQALFVGGSNDVDTITVKPTADTTDDPGAVTVSVETNGQSITGDFVPTGAILISGVGSNDTITVDAAVFTPTAISGGEGDDTITSGSGGDYIDGGPGNDNIVGGAGNDTMVSAEGDDTMEGGLGNDESLIRGFSAKTLVDEDGPDGGIDTIDFSLVPESTIENEGVTLDLSMDDAEVQQVRSDGQVSLKGTFENVKGTSFNDSLSGNTESNLLFGGTGEDSISGGGLGDDTLDGGDGSDTLTGGDGNDMIFGGTGDDSIIGGSGDSGNETLSGGDGNDMIFGGAGGDDSVDGGYGNDTITGGDGNDMIFGGAGDDSITGGSGGDGSETLSGGDGNDMIFGGSGGDDSVDGGYGNDTITGGDGNDMIFGGAGDDSIIGGAGGDGNETLSGGDGNDMIFGGSGGNDSVDGGYGNDTITGGDGNDMIFGGAGDDSIVGGDGTFDETLSGGDGNDMIFGGSGGNDSVDGGYGDDTITGGTGNETLVGGDGNDMIFGGTNGDDSVYGGDGNDTLTGSDGNDMIFGGAGDDSIIGGDGTLDETLSGGDGNDMIFGGTGGNDSIEGGYGDDTITGSDGNDMIFGGAGDDSIVGGDGTFNETLSGGDGNDMIFGGAGGDDSIDGGYGDDTITGSDGNDMIFGGAGDDSIVGGDGTFNETLSGGDGNDMIFGGAGGDDSIDGGYGDDTLIGSDGNDMIFGGAGDDSIIGGDGTFNETLAGGDGNDMIFGGTGGDDSIDGGYGDDTLTGSDGNDMIFGGAGDDSITGSDGPFNDTLVGGDGNDMIFGGGSGDDSVDGGLGDDTIAGGSGDETLIGGDGNDMIFGGGSGNDSVDGGYGNDTIDGGDGNETLIGGDGNDMIFGGTGGDDSIEGGFGDDTLTGGDGNDMIFGGPGSDTFTVTGGSATLFGNDDVGPDSDRDTLIVESNQDVLLTDSDLRIGDASLPIESLPLASLNDIQFARLAGGDGDNLIDASGFSGDAVLLGGAGNDTLLGGSGNDTLLSGSGDDALDGGAGDDIYGIGAGDSGSKTLTEAVGNGSDTLDFSLLADSLNINLWSADTQTVSSGLSLTLTNPQAFENVYGTSLNDVIVGNDADNELYGLGGLDDLDGRAGNDLLQAGYSRTVVLDFTSQTDGSDHIYSDAEKAGIVERVRADYAQFDIKVLTQDEIDASPTPLFEGPFITVVFNAGTGSAGNLIVGGRAERLGWRELVGSGVVSVNVNAFLGETGNKLPGTSENFIALSSTVAAHELAHMYGLRHHDSFGPVGSGIFSNVRDLSLPSFAGPRGADETTTSLIASPASVGTTLIDALGDPEFGQRELIKMAFAESGRTVVELDQAAKTLADIGDRSQFVQDLGSLPLVSVPQTDPTGQPLVASATNVVGQIELGPEGVSESDYFSFTGNAGDWVTVELLSQTIDYRIANVVDTVVRVYGPEGNIVDHYDELGAFNDNGFESIDALLLDLYLPEDGVYTIEVDSFSFNLPEVPTYLPQFYDDSGVVTVCPAGSAAVFCADTDTGSYEMFVYKVENPATAPIADGDTLTGGAGGDRLVGNSGNETVFGFNEAEGDLAEGSIDLSSDKVFRVPLITIGENDSAAETLIETDSGLATSGTLSVSDLNLNDIVTAAVDSVAVDGNAGSVSNQALQAMLDFTAETVIDSTTTTGTIEWIFNSDLEAFDQLTATEPLVLTYTISVSDGLNTDTQEVVITVVGTNDAATITGDTSGDLTEDATTTLADGSLTVTDVDSGQAVFQTPTSLTGVYGNFTFNAVTGDWTYTIDNTDSAPTPWWPVRWSMTS